MAKVSQEVTFAASPAQVYEALLSSAKHSEFTGAPASIDAKVGGLWSAYDGKISGVTLELVPASLLVQTWRAGNWPAGMHSVVKFELAPNAQGATLKLEHDALSDEQVPHIEGGWEKMYWEPLRKYLSK